MNLRGVNYELTTTFPTRVLNENDMTINEAKVGGGVIIVKLI